MAKSVRPSASTPTCWYHVVSFIFIHCLSDLLSIHPLAWAERTPVEAFSSPCSASSFQLRQRFRQKARLCLYRVPSPLSRNADAFGNPTNAMPFPKVGLMLLAMLSSTFMLVAIMKYDVKAKDPNYPSFQRFWASRWTTVNHGVVFTYIGIERFPMALSTWTASRCAKNGWFDVWVVRLYQASKRGWRSDHDLSIWNRLFYIQYYDCSEIIYMWQLMVHCLFDFFVLQRCESDWRFSFRAFNVGEKEIRRCFFYCAFSC